MEFQGKSIFMVPLITAYFMIIGIVLYSRKGGVKLSGKYREHGILVFFQHIQQFGCYSHCQDFCVCKQIDLWGNQERGTDPFSVFSLVLQHESSQHCGSLHTIFMNIFAFYLSSGMHKM